LVTRATRHDKEDIRDFLTTRGEGYLDLDEGTAFIARDGEVVGCVRVVDAEPGALVVDDVLVSDDRRGKGIGTRLMTAAMNNRGGTMYLCCHDDVIPFYARLGFTQIPIEQAPKAVVAYWRKIGDYPTSEGHVHRFMKAR
jgi:N-acetylglutamate synthase-like GNAT family acetyltransferase